MYRNLIASVNRISSRVQSLQMELVMRWVNNRGENALADLGYALEQITEIATEVSALQSFLRSEIRADNPPPPLRGAPDDPIRLG